MHALANQVQRQFGPLLLAAFGLGLGLPGLSTVPGWVIPSLLATVLFFACARITPSDLERVSPRQVITFYLARFGLLPLAGWALASTVWPEGSTAVLLFLLIPTGVTTAAITGILGGNPVLALGTTAVSTLLAPLAIPLAFGLVGAGSVDPRAVGVTLLAILIVPAVLYFGLARRSERLVATLQTWGGLVSIGLICTIAVLVSSAQRDRILADPVGLAGLIVLGLGLYAALYTLGVLWGRRAGVREQISWTLSHGNNNIVLGLTLALLYLTPDDVVRFVAWDIAWIMGLSAIQPVLRRVSPLPAEG